MIPRYAHIAILFLAIVLFDAAFARDKFLVRKGGRLDRLHKRTLSEWKHAAHHHKSRRHRHKRRRHYRDGGFRIDHVLAQMDSFVRPRFGRSVGFTDWRNHVS
ncbi:unnamed protein product [Caenorhabditis auriculariae]|uniref:Uncharacterized protein n=1 Tax=Caenorhabditis auriculariae TaxID=2777116 RepID=A0A8S1HF68_9PELO|nr:unnamed protein product [Caenorhabditis auriculariae]